MSCIGYAMKFVGEKSAAIAKATMRSTDKKVAARNEEFEAKAGVQAARLGVKK